MHLFFILGILTSLYLYKICFCRSVLLSVTLLMALVQICVAGKVINIVLLTVTLLNAFSKNTFENVLQIDTAGITVRNVRSTQLTVVNVCR